MGVEMYKILVLSQTYPSHDSPYRMMYVHNRNLNYTSELDLTVLSFSTNKKYVYQGISVVPERGVDLSDYDLIISHAPNVKNHLRLLSKYSGNMIFFFHGHEALDYTKYYPGSYGGRDARFSFLRKAYEKLKLLALRKFIAKRIERSTLIFVSEWMRNEFEKNVLELDGRFESAVINNGVNDVYVKRKWDREKEKKFDFITIRPLSGKKYAVDVVVELANKMPEKNFLLYGEGDIFNYYEKPDNVTWYNEFLAPEKVPEMLDMAKCALMPTRLDAQGVMMCEIACYGMPLITSNIPVCRDILADFDNVSFIDNSDPVIRSIPKPCLKHVHDLKFNQKRLSLLEEKIILNSLPRIG